MVPSDVRATVRCPECGAWQVAGAARCVACGAALAPAPAQTEVHVSDMHDMHDMPTTLAPAYQIDVPAPFSTADAEPSPDAAPSEIEQSAQTDDSPVSSTLAGGSRRCEWCGEPNPEGAARCTKCGAVFPRPEQDEALLRASQERIRAATESLEVMRRQRTKRGLGRLWDR